MTKDPSPSSIYDMVIIGGGIAGAAIARDAALRGTSVILLEKNRFGSGTSGQTSKLIHGGIRYLEIAWDALKRAQFGEAWKNFRFVCQALQECRTLERLAPNLVKPLPLILPIYASDSRRRWSIYTGVLLYYVLGLCSGGARAPKIFWRTNSITQLLPELRTEGLLGGVMIWDRLTDDRALVQSIMSSAARAGAKTQENIAVQTYHYDSNQKMFVISVRDQSGRDFECRARTLVNATGPWIDEMRERGNEKDQAWIEPIAGSHIVFKPFLPQSVLLQAQDQRFFFCIHVGHQMRVGTTERLHANPDTVKATREDIQYLLDSLSFYFPKLKLRREDILETDAGVRPLFKSKGPKKASTISREHELIQSPSGMLNIIGVKLTDHRRAAKKAVDLLLPELLKFNPRIQRRCRTDREPY